MRNYFRKSTLDSPPTKENVISGYNIELQMKFYRIVTFKIQAQYNQIFFLFDPVNPG